MDSTYRTLIAILAFSGLYGKFAPDIFGDYPEVYDWQQLEGPAGLYRIAAAESVWQTLERLGRQPVGCVAWRRTFDCDPFGRRHFGVDGNCTTVVGSQPSGFCECEGGLITAAVGCKDHPRFTCIEECAKLAISGPSTALRKPEGIKCASRQEGDTDALQWPELSFSTPEDVTETETGSNGDGRVVARASQRARQKIPQSEFLDPAQFQVGWLWREIDAAYLAADGLNVVEPPGLRTQLGEDFVEEGNRLLPSDVEFARNQWKKFLDNAPEFPPDMFKGKGIVICGGGLQHMIAAWVNILMLRRNGCTLPVELWFLAHEYPPPTMVQALADHGVISRNLEDVYPGGSTSVFTSYRIKAAALLLSRFQEVIFLDADIVSVLDPEFLFDTPQYKQTGAIFWPDYWNCSISPDFFEIVELAPKDGPTGTHESGQMVVNKRRNWRPLLLALFFNMQASLYYPLLTDYLGQGDKETFALAHMVLGVKVHQVNWPVGSAGMMRRLDSEGNPSYFGNTMVQHRPDRASLDPQSVLFLHSNLPKWGIAIPDDFSIYKRRWEILLERNQDRVQSSKGVDFQLATAYLGYDVERTCVHFIKQFRCASFFASYIDVRMKRFGEKIDLVPGDGISHGWYGTYGGIDLEWLKLPYRNNLIPGAHSRERNGLYISSKQREKIRREREQRMAEARRQMRFRSGGQFVLHGGPSSFMLSGWPKLTTLLHKLFR
ncbi:hypothetical protein CYMTET_38821 [Cymbomonas tetramitiformis]|uniref:Uncharacterized protein n=1 Tax=Cymbomonas tetramitiformis TaxID=36881 RepID=A0AAE0F538_9CHLO|nr:hypothetical protein CYMTET_38821 [Cymbomonas tetramitiformis]